MNKGYKGKVKVFKTQIKGSWGLLEGLEKIKNEERLLRDKINGNIYEKLG